ncbi:MAG: hypothetical protein ACFBSE_18255 [Prochloraceae cyanobacterium]
MQLTAQPKAKKDNILTEIKSFAIWCFTLTVCFLVVGFPVGFLLVTVGVLATIVLHAVMPISSVILVGAALLAVNVLVVLVSAAALTIRGIKPNEVTWLSWLHGDAEPEYTTTYASCPLSCSLPEQ